MPGSWFEKFVLAQSALFLLQSVCHNPIYDVPQCHLYAPNDSMIPLATADELRRHTFVRHQTRTESRKKVRHTFHWGSKKLSAKFQGFILFKTEDPNAKLFPDFVRREELDEWTAVFHDRLPALLRTDPYYGQFHPIFARLNTRTVLRKSDKKRCQLKFSQMLKVARKELHEANNSRQCVTDKGKASRSKRIDDAKANLDLVALATRLIARHYERIVQVHSHGGTQAFRIPRVVTQCFAAVPS